MNARLSLFLLVVFPLLSACSLNQQLHSFPKEAAALIENEPCDCEAVEFIEEEPELVFDRGLVSREKTSGYVLRKDGSHQPYSLIKGALYVDKDLNLLHISGRKGIIIEPGSEKTETFSRTHMTFHGVKQVVDLLNPFDGEEYTLSAGYNGESINVAIENSQNDKTSRVGNIDSAHTGNINGHAYQLNIERQWQGTGEKIHVDGENVWHQYPDGAFFTLSNDEGMEAKVFQGAGTGKMMGMDVFSGNRSIAFLPTGISDTIKRDMFLFYYGIDFFQTFVDDIQMLPGCLNYPEEQSAGECPGNVVIE